MTLRPRRRISPRTKRRYRAIRNFFRRTLGSIASQPDIKINSSIAVNVTDLNHKIVGIEHQLDEVCKNCHDLVSFENISRKEIESFIPTEGNGISSSKIQKGCHSDKKLSEKDTKLLYKTSESHFRKAENSGIINDFYNEPRDRHSSKTMNYEECGASVATILKSKSKKSRRDIYYENFDVSNTNLRKNRTRLQYENSALYADSYPSLTAPKAAPPAAPARPGHRHGRRQAWQEQPPTCPIQEEAKVKTRKDKIKRNKSESPTRRQEKRHGKTKKDNINPVGDELDQDFIADLIQRQYKPVKFFGRRSDTSQISFPVCRDHEFPLREDVTNGSEMCSCCLTGRGPARRRRARGPAVADVADMRSLCDTRLYNARRRVRKHQPDTYNDSDQYDVVPVKEKSSPKSRRKFVEDNMHYEHLEVPPSPRSHRPRLNLQAQNYSGCQDISMTRIKQSRRKRSPYQQRRHEYVDCFRSEISSEESTPIENTEIKPKSTKNAEIQEDMGTMSSLQYPGVGNEKTYTTFNDTLNKTDSNVDKTDKALSEIKDILQSFLQEIKKESASQCDKSSEVIDKTNEKCFEGFQHESVRITPTGMQNGGHNDFPGYELGPRSLPAMPPPYLANPCCYRVMPVCPMNCVQNGYLVASPSYTCQGCVNSHNESDIRHGAYIPKESNICETNTSNINTETDNLIREIYKYVAQNPNIRKEVSSENNKMRDADEANTKKLTSRSVGKSSFPSRHDAGVCTLPPRCYSKSCEAISSRPPADARSRTNASYSDTVLEKISLDATTQSSSTYETSDSSILDKGKKSKFASVLQSFGLLKRNKKNRKDVIEEVSETESSTEVDAKPKQRHPFRQDFTNYMMHTQEFNRPPPMPPPHRERHHSPRYDCGGYYSYDSRMNEPVNDMYESYRERMHAHASAPPYSRIRPEASAPPYPCPYERCSHNMQPQVPLCLKEIEVQSTGTQSERRMPFFRKLSQRKPAPASSSQPSRDTNLKNYGTQTAQSKPGLWKELQAKAASKKKFPDFDSFAFSMKDQKKLADGDNKMRNAMLKKLFYKRNPFSPRNLIVRTLMGNDRSSWGIPPSGMVKRPRMFL